MRYALFVDWENVWYEHIGRCAPSYSHPDSFTKRAKLGITLPNYPEVKSLDRACLDKLRQLPATLLEACKQAFGCAPERAVATALWEFLPFHDELGLRALVREAGFITTHPTVDINKTSRKDRKNVSDYKLTLDLMSHALIEKMAARGEPAQLNKKARFDTFVIVSGDFIFGQLIDFARRALGADVRLIAHTHNISGALFAKMREPHLLQKLIFLETLPAYVQLKAQTLTLDRLHQHKGTLKPSDTDLFAMTLIKRLNDKIRQGEKPRVTTHEAISWMEQWITYWSKACGRIVTLSPGNALVTLEAKGTIRIEPRARHNYVCLNNPSSAPHISDAIALDTVRKYAFEHLFDIPPVYFAK